MWWIGLVHKNRITDKILNHMLEGCQQLNEIFKYIELHYNVNKWKWSTERNENIHKISLSFWYMLSNIELQAESVGD